MKGAKLGTNKHTKKDWVACGAVIKEKRAESIEPSDSQCSGNKSLYLYFKLTSVEKKGNFEGTIPHDNWTFHENRYDYVEQLEWPFFFFCNIPYLPWWTHISLLEEHRKILSSLSLPLAWTRWFFLHSVEKSVRS